MILNLKRLLNLYKRRLLFVHLPQSSFIYSYCVESPIKVYRLLLTLFNTPSGTPLPGARQYGPRTVTVRPTTVTERNRDLERGCKVGDLSGKKVITEGNIKSSR